MAVSAAPVDLVTVLPLDTNAPLDFATEPPTGRVHDEGARPGPDVQGDALGGTDVTVVMVTQGSYADLGGTVSNPLIGTAM
jgi:hypothetical protein